MEFARDSFDLGNIQGKATEKIGGIMKGKIEQLKKERRTLKTSNTKRLNELAAELSTKSPNKEISRKNYRTLTSDGMNYY